MHKSTAVILIILLLGVSTATVLWKNSDKTENETPLPMPIPEKTTYTVIVLPPPPLPKNKEEISTIKESAQEDPEKIYTSNRITTSTKKQGYLEYKNTDFGLEIAIPETIHKVHEFSNQRIGEALLQFEETNAAPSFFEVFIRKGDVFKKMQEATDDDIAYYDWDLFYEEFQKKVILKSQTLRKYEKISEINGLVFLTGYYYNPELDSFVRFYRTYKGDLEVTLNYYFPVDWYGENFSYIDNTTKISQELMQGLMSATTKKNIQFFENLVTTLKIK